MITFQTMRWKNFLSTGDNWSTLDFQKANTTLVVGDNGAGKSTMLDAYLLVCLEKLIDQLVRRN